eukprot:1648795-Lingulodinium_polyedra.AAC.1
MKRPRCSRQRRAIRRALLRRGRQLGLDPQLGLKDQEALAHAVLARLRRHAAFHDALQQQLCLPRLVHVEARAVHRPD